MSGRATGNPTRSHLAPARPVEVQVQPSDLPLLLRPLLPSDRDEFIRIARLSRAHLDRWLPIHRPGETDEALFERQLRLTIDGEKHLKAHRRVAITPRPAGPDRILGAFNLISITRGLELSADLNWWVAADTLGRGIGERGLSMLIRQALSDPPAGLGLHLLRAYIQRDNSPSIRLAEHAGFARCEDGCSHIQTGDRWVIHDLYTLAAE